MPRSSKGWLSSAEVLFFLGVVIGSTMMYVFFASTGSPAFSFEQSIPPRDDVAVEAAGAAAALPSRAVPSPAAADGRPAAQVVEPVARSHPSQVVEPVPEIVRKDNDPQRSVGALPVEPGPIVGTAGKSPSETQLLLDIYKQLCAWGIPDVGDLKNGAATQEQRDTIEQMYAPIVQMPPPVPLDAERPGGRLSGAGVDCRPKNPGLSKLLTGRLRPEGPRMIIDVSTGMGGGGELDLLELRLHELDGVVDRYVVTESPHGNRCDKKPMHFWKQRHRFSDFLDRIEYITTEPCKKYMEDSRRCHAMEVKKRPKELYFQQNNQRDCAWDEMKKKLDGIPEDALVVLTDLDEIPWGKTLNLLKHCEVKKSVRFPLRMQQQVIPFSLRNGCPESRKRYNKGNIALWKQLFNGKLNGPQAIWPQKGTDQLELAGVHLTNYGTRGQVDYRLLNHGASGQLLPLMMQGGKRITLCDVTSVEHVQSMQQQYLDSPISVVRNWEKEKNGKLKYDPKTKLPTVKTADLAKCEIPWPLLARPERYPTFWGKPV